MQNNHSIRKMNPFGVNFLRPLYLALLLCVTISAFPTEKNVPEKAESKVATTSEVAPTKTQNTKASEAPNSFGISTTSSLLFKDKTPILTYLLGQPKNRETISSPADLLSPDRYEFFTFDDDGQIVKKLMSVKEIQKIIANNEKGFSGDRGSPIEYYQILTVTPDVESIPSVSRINPNEPLFSIHDVIASVQNVLKSEIKTKQSQSAPNLNGTNYIASASSDHFEIITEKPPSSFKVGIQKVTSSTSQQTTNAPPSTFTIKEEVSAVTEKSGAQQPFTIVEEKVQATDSPSSQKPLQASTITHVPVPLVSSSATPKPVQLSASSAAETILLDSSTQATVSVTTPESKPLSLIDAHPGLISNETFLDMKPITVQLVSRIEEPFTQELKTAASSNFAGNFVKVQTVEPVKTQAVETSTTKVEIPITPDLSDSVSSVLWQIASENSMLDGLSKPTESVLVASSEAKAPETTQEQTKVSFSSSTTEFPAQSRSTEKSENPLIALENILRTQNKPRPFQKIPLIEKGTSEGVESRIEPVSTTPSYEPVPSASSTVVILTEKDETPLSSTASPVSTTSSSPGFVVSVSPDAVVQSPEHVKPVTDKVSSNVNKTNPTNFQQAIDVQVIQEANIGQIPRTTEYPGQVVKDIDRKESPNPEFVSTEETLVDSASSTYSTILPAVTPEVTTVVEHIEERTEISEEVGNVEQTTVENLEPLETKSVDDVKETSASDRVDITFVPMIIKSPTDFKQEESIKIENQAEIKEEPTNTEKVLENREAETETTEASEKENIPTTTLAESQEEIQSKESVDGEIELKNEPKVTTEAIQKETVLSDDGADIGTLKQNFPIKPLFGKPSKPVFTKPIKIKTPTIKPSATIKPFTGAKEPEKKKPYENHLQSSPTVLELDAAPDENLGLEATVANLDGDIKKFADLCNELAFSLWSSVTHNGLSFVRSVVVSPFAVTSLLAMVFLGARGPTSGQMNDVLRLDDMVTFNPHLVFRNVTESLVISRNPGVATTAFVRELYSDKSKGKLLDFYKERVQQFYDGHVEEVNFKTIGDTLRRQTNHLVKRQTWGKITDFLRGSNLMPRPPLAAFSANIFQTDCTKASTKERDGEMYFVILPSSRLRRLVPIPAVVWRDGFLAGYEPNLDATAVAINPSDSIVSTIFVLPGQQGLIAPGDTLARLEHHLLGSSYKKGHWSRLMRSLLPRPGLELQIPRLSHKSVINVTSSLQRMGLRDLFSADRADLTGLNGLANDLHLSDMLQVNLFSTCGEEPIGSRHHSEVYPATPILRREKTSDNLFSESADNLFAVSDFEDPAISALPLELRPRQARVPLSAPGVRIPEPPRLRFDRPFLFFVRHNPTGLILHMGRFNPRLMP